MKNLKCTVLALTMGASVFIGGKAFAQVPSYVPSNGLVGWWPFNGNANDESGNSNNGTVNGATLTTDRFGNVNKAYKLITANRINVNNNSSLQITQNISISFWVYLFANGETLIRKGYDYGADIGNISNTQPGSYLIFFSPNLFSTNMLALQSWNHVVVLKNGSSRSVFINGVLNSSTINSPNYNVSNNPLTFGSWNNEIIDAKLDDIGIWNRALTQQEISNLYKSCGHEITSQPINVNINAGSNTQFSVNSISGSSCQWQSNPLNMGWQNITNNSSYSGATSNTLSVSNAAVSNHNQPFRAIVNAGTCIDTSDIAQIIIGDTCLSTIYDTLLTTVTDTLIINTTLSLPSPNNENTIKIYPNPASDHITIDNGNFPAMAGYSIKITTNAGQQVFQSAINQAQFYVDLSTWTGNGLYFVHLIDPQNNTVTVRKIVLQ